MPQQPLTPEELADRLALLEEQAEQGHSASADPTLTTLKAELDTVLTSLRSPAAQDSIGEESACQEVIARVQALDRESCKRAADDTSVSWNTSSDQVPMAQLGVYELLTKLGEGGMGAVYKARHAKLDKIVAIKVLPAAQMKDEQAVSRFEREMRAVGKLEHPHIVRAMDAGVADGVHYLAMEFVQGIDLSQLVKQCHPLPIADACELIRQAALGLEEAHESGMVHRDIKPSNMMLCVTGRRKPPIVKILDLGLAHLSDAHAPNAQGLTTTGQMMGTLDYMAPEQGGDSKGVDIRADIYALGASLYKLLCGEAIYYGEKYQTPVQKMMALATQPAPPIQSRRPETPVALASVLHRMLEKNPEQRYATPGEVALALAPFCGGANLTALLQRVGIATAAPEDATPSQPALLNTGIQSSISEATAVFANQDAARPTVAPQTATGGRKSPPWIPKAIAAGIGGATLLAIAAAIVLFIPTAEGTLRVEINDPALEVVVKGHDIILKKSEKEEIKLTPGKQTLIVKRGDFEFETKNFELKKGLETVVKVDFVPGEIRVALRDGTSLGVHKLDSTPPTVVNEATVNTSVPRTPPAGLEKPFVVMRDGKRFRELKNFAGAMSECQAGDQIDIYCDNPISLVLVEHSDKPLHIRGAGGFRPKLIYTPTLLAFRAPVTLEHCDLVMLFGNVNVSDTEFRLHNCKVSGGGAFCLYGPAAKFTAKDSLLVWGLDGLSIVSDKPGVRIRVENCLVRSSRYFALLNNTRDVQLEVRNSTIYSAGMLNGDEQATAQVVAEGNIFDHRSGADFFALPNWRQQVQWEGKNNLYSGMLFNVLNDQRQIERQATLEEWAALWKRPEVGSKLVKQCEPFFVRASYLPLPELRTLAEPFVEAARKEFQLSELGCNWDLVGPGEAYLKALAAAGREAKELRPEVSAEGPFALIRSGAEVASYRTLIEAVKQAKDRDVIELRTDEKLPSIEIMSDTARRLTIRAGAGYSPILQNTAFFSKDVWNLEGLTLAGAVGLQGGGIHSVVNCTVLPDGVNDPNWQIWQMLPDGDKPPRIINSRLLWLRAAAPKGVKILFENSVICRLDSGESEELAGTGNLEFIRCTFWAPDPQFVSCILSYGKTNYRVRKCYFAVPFNLVNYFTHQSFAPPVPWQGEGNVYAIPASYVVGVGTLGIDQWKKWVAQEEGSFETFSPLFSPRLWKLTPGTPGSGAGSDGKDQGADTSTVATPSPTTSAKK